MSVATFCILLALAILLKTCIVCADVHVCVQVIAARFKPGRCEVALRRRNTGYCKMAANASTTLGISLRDLAIAAVAGAMASIAVLVAQRRVLKQQTSTSGFRVCAVRLTNKQDIKKGILALAKENKLQAGTVLSCVGSCEGAHIRLANADRDHQNETLRLEGRYEILSLIGTVAQDGKCHLHISLGDAKGNVIGGHLMGDIPVFTTAEVVLGECEDLRWNREFDECTGFDELTVLQP
ncbi:AT-hook motif nuclear-localized protein 14 [Hondaea fermentalgiana]|uniref:AT-hook motif nuclear-localized protein 14 n=1 Tax=Hondaea fermentalgiana TaxID=2315210 RepID=A0A2R5G1S9_9STRA|nr:AT-hook motif nuclear-localized protein 14 [Hondaea fermentalgiana]|eukprot:GBG24977.1 AT-hook motif nuclear-localized protein 14 [Hondaea fermentalgiana]